MEDFERQTWRNLFAPCSARCRGVFDKTRDSFRRFLHSTQDAPSAPGPVSVRFALLLTPLNGLICIYAQAHMKVIRSIRQVQTYVKANMFMLLSRALWQG